MILQIGETMSNETLKVFQSEFEDKLKLPNNPVCQRCDAKIKHPLLPWIVGSKYWDTKERLLFVGKPHRGKAGTLLPSGIFDSTRPHLDWLMNCPWAYWSYTKEIAIRLFGEDNPWDFVSFTNIVKCTNVPADGKSYFTDKTSYLMAKSCIKDLGVIFHEIELIKPKNIIFYTYSIFKEMLEELPFITSEKEITKKDYRVKCGNKTLPWWERSVTTNWENNVRVLVTGHPQFMNRKDYIALLTKWVKISQ